MPARPHDGGVDASSDNKCRVTVCKQGMLFHCVGKAIPQVCCRKYRKTMLLMAICRKHRNTHAAHVGYAPICMYLLVRHCRGALCHQARGSNHPSAHTQTDTHQHRSVTCACHNTEVYTSPVAVCMYRRNMTAACNRKMTSLSA